MTEIIEMDFRHRPSVVAYMLRALARWPARAPYPSPPAIIARWRDCWPTASDLAAFRRLTGLGDAKGFSLLFPQVYSFPLQMAVVTHPRFPFPIWNALQVRNHLTQYLPLDGSVALTMETSVSGQRLLPKGVEVDLRTTVSSREGLHWEGTTTFYYRGRPADPGAPSPLARSPESPASMVASWTAPVSGRWRFGRLTGDFNGIHLWNRYAQLLGFRRAFLHPQRELGQCLARVDGPDSSRPQRLDVWLKGPVYYGSPVRLRAQTVDDASVFALALAGEDRPAVVGRWQAAWPAERPGS